MRRSNIAEEKMLMTNPPVNLELEVVHLGLAPVCVLVILPLLVRSWDRLKIEGR